MRKTHCLTHTKKYGLKEWLVQISLVGCFPHHHFLLLCPSDLPKAEMGCNAPSSRSKGPADFCECCPSGWPCASDMHGQVPQLAPPLFHSGKGTEFTLQLRGLMRYQRGFESPQLVSTRCSQCSCQREMRFLNRRLVGQERSLNFTYPEKCCHKLQTP